MTGNRGNRRRLSAGKSSALALAAVMGLGSASLDAQSLDFLMQAPNFGRLTFRFEVEGSEVVVDSVLRYDDKGKLVAASPSTVDEHPVNVAGKIKNVDGVWTFSITYKGAFIPLKVSIAGNFGDAAAVCSYKGPKGKAADLPATLEVFPGAAPVDANLTLLPDVSCRGAITGSASVVAAYGAGLTRVGTLKGKVTAEALNFTVVAGTARLKFKGVRNGDVYTGALSVKFPPEKSVLTLDIPFTLPPPGDCSGGTSDTRAPTVAITQPGAGASVFNTVSIAADATDNVAVVGVQMLLDGAPLGDEIARAPFVFEWDTTAVADGSHTLSARARDAAGNSAQAPEVVVEVINHDAEAPTVSLTSLESGAVVGGSILLEASADDNLAVASVQFYVNGEPFGGEITAPPYIRSWNTFSVENGPFDLGALAKDAAGNSAFAPEIQVTVDNGVRTPPVAAFAFEEAGGGFIADSSGNGNVGALFGPERIDEGRFGRGLLLDGLDDQAIVGHSSSLNLSGGMTLEAWVYPASTIDSVEAVLVKGGFIKPYLLYAGGVSNGPVAAVTKLGTGTPVPVRDLKKLPANTWSHIAGTYDGVTLRLYVNGVQADMWGVNGAIESDAGPLRIGAAGPNDNFFGGRIDEIRIYSRALPVEEILYDMETPVLSGPAPTPLEDLHEAIDNLAPGSWLEIPSSFMQYVAYRYRDPANTLGDVSGVMESASGGFYDPVRNRLVVWGGGQQYCGNEIYAFDLDALQWLRVTDPSPFPAGDDRNQSKSTTHPDGAPISRHSYDFIDYIPGLDRFFVGSGVAVCPDGNLGDRGAYWFDFETATWESRAGSPAFGESLGAVAPDGTVWQHGSLSGSPNDNTLASYDPMTDTWTRHAAFIGTLNSRATAEIDPARNFFVVVGLGNTYVWDLDNPGNAAVILASTGATEIEDRSAPGLAYHPGRDRLVAWQGGRDVYSLDIDNAVWTLEPSAGAVDPGAAATRGTYGRWRYVPSRNVFVQVSGISRNVFLYRLPE